MLIGTQTSKYYLRHADEEGAIRMIAEAGFDCVDISFFQHPCNENIWTMTDAEFDAYFKRLASVANECGVKIDQTHAPFPTWKDDDGDEMSTQRIEKSIRATAILGGRITVVHPGMTGMSKYGMNSGYVRELNMKRYASLRPCLEEYGVMAAIENMFSRDSKNGLICPTVCTTAEEMVSYIDELGDDVFCACLDIGHANLIHHDGYETVAPADMIHILSHRLKALHVHDNDGIDDRHFAPYNGNIDWDSVCKALRDVNYDGVFTLEADNYFDRYPVALEKDCLRFMCAIARQLAGKVYPPTE